MCPFKILEWLLAAHELKPKLLTSPFKTWPHPLYTASFSSSAVYLEPCVLASPNMRSLRLVVGLGCPLYPQCFLFFSWVQHHALPYILACIRTYLVYLWFLFSLWDPGPKMPPLWSIFSLSQSDSGTSSSSLALPLHTSDETHHFFFIAIFSLQAFSLWW